VAQSLVRRGHLGLAGMVERARLFGGELQVGSHPGEGATVTLRLPFPPAASDTDPD
jgi:signal transduction histidine kinase